MIFQGGLVLRCAGCGSIVRFPTDTSTGGEPSPEVYKGEHNADHTCLLQDCATAALLAGGGWSPNTYLSAKTDEHRTAALEAKKPFLTKRIEGYAETVNLASHRSNTADEIRDKRGKQEISQRENEAAANPIHGATACVSVMRFAVLQGDGPQSKMCDTSLTQPFSGCS
jgi:hypothetical protein